MSTGKTLDKTFLYTTLALTGIGLVFVADISAPQGLSFFGDKYYFIKQQLLWVFIGIVALFVTSLINYKLWKKLAVPAFFVSVIFLVLVLLPGLGFKTLGARRWLHLGPIRFQPSEVVKLTLALYLAKVAESKKNVLSYFVPLLVVCALIMLQPDLGSTIVVATIAVVQIFIAGVSIKYLLIMGISGFALAALAIITSPYRRDRLMTFLKITSDPLGKAYHIRQILLALGSGGMFGLGLGQSRQKFLFLPEAATDSIFAAMAEEIGFIGSLILVGSFIFLTIRMFKIAALAPDDFSRVLASGIAAWISGQTFFNLASMTAVTPLTGIPLPFFSYGGSSILMILFSCGILLNISRYAIIKKRR